MIYTLTLNPSLDYVMEMDNFTKGKMNRSKNAYLLPGGKGINVSCVLSALEMENTAILPVAGFTGEKLLQMLSKKGLSYEAVKLSEGDTRINVKVLGQEETELNAMGPSFSKEEKDCLMEKCEGLGMDDVLILSGSVPSDIGTAFYACIMERLKDKKVKVVLDTIGESFLKALSYKPFLVKPNAEELKELFGTGEADRNELISLAKKVREMGAENVLVSLGSEGAFLLKENGEVIYETAPKGRVMNTVGAGDSMVAGFVAGYLKSGDYPMALRMGIAAGSASAFSKNLATKEEIDALMKNL